MISAVASPAVVRRTEQWFVRQGAPTMIGGYGFRSHVLPRMLPALTFVAVGSMYFSVISMSDAEHRQRFFAPLIEKLERTLEVRAVYLAVRERVQA